MFDTQVYHRRREKLRKTVGSGILIFPGNRQIGRNFEANIYPFRQDSTFLYYFGLQRPGLVAVLDCESGREYLFGDDADTDVIVWTGPQERVATMAERCGIQHSTDLKSLVQFFEVFTQSGHTTIHYLPTYRADQREFLHQITGIHQKQIKTGWSEALVRAVVAQRSVKDELEIAEMHKAATLTSDMHKLIMGLAAPGMHEAELAHASQKFIADRGGTFSFPPIMSVRGEILHNEHYENKLETGDLLLFDGGTETTMGYAADMTRTIPVDFTFTQQQEEIYQIVYDAQEAAINALKSGARFLDIHLLAAQKIVDGLKHIGLMQGDTEEAAQAGAHTLFFPCGLGHMIGLDVHDMENLGEQYVGYTDQLTQSKEFGLKSLRLARELQQGFAVTVEPGIYFIPALIDLYKGQRKYENFVRYDKLDAYRDFGGIRIEDDFVITGSGAELLGRPLARHAEEVEGLRR